MNAVTSWLATLGVVGVIFVVGKYLQHCETRERVTKRAEKAIRDEMAEHAPSPELELLRRIFGPYYGERERESYARKAR